MRKESFIKGRATITLVCLAVALKLVSVGVAQQPSGENQAFKTIAGAPEHRIGKGDLLELTVWNGENLETAKARVAEDGTLFVPFGLNRNLRVEGLCSSELKQTMLQELRRFFRQPEVQVVVEEYRSNRAYLLGEVSASGGVGGPGLYPLQGRKTVLEFIIEHGGVTANGNLLHVQISRPDGGRQTVNLSDAIFLGDQTQNPTVSPGDIVWVPPKEVGANTYYVMGHVRNPGVIVSQTKIGIVELLARAGSLTTDGSRTGIFIVRGTAQNPEILKVDLKRLVEKGDLSQNIEVRNGDIVYVSRSVMAQMRDVLSVVTPMMFILQSSIYVGQNVD